MPLHISEIKMFTILFNYLCSTLHHTCRMRTYLLLLLLISRANPFAVNQQYCDQGQPFAFQCPIGPCLYKAALCDGIDECGDNADESHDICGNYDGCPNEPTLYPHHCLNGNCISGFKVCDGNDDCGDGSDESTCTCEANGDPCGAMHVAPTSCTISPYALLCGQLGSSCTGERVPFRLKLSWTDGNGNIIKANYFAPCAVDCVYTQSETDCDCASETKVITTTSTVAEEFGGTCPPATETVDCLAVDCEFSETESTCDCDTGTKMITRTIDVPAEYCGTACPALEEPVACVPTNCPQCFSGDTYVFTHKGRKMLRDVKDNDMIAAVHGRMVIYQPVWWFTHKESRKRAWFHQIRTRGNSTIELSNNHLIPVVPCDLDVETMWIDPILAAFSVFARYVREGDCVISPELGSLMTDEVVEVRMVEKVGYYSPVTKAGNVIVDNVVASCYSEIPDHWLQHTVFGHLRSIAFRLTGKASISNEKGTIPLILRLLHAAGQVLVKEVHKYPRQIE